MVEALFGFGGFVAGSAAGFFGRLYFERRAERRADAETTRHRREDQAEAIDSFLRSVEQFTWAAGGTVRKSGSTAGWSPLLSEIHATMGLAYAAVTVLHDEIGDHAARRTAYTELTLGLTAAKEAYEAVIHAVDAKDETTFNTANSSSIVAIADVRRALGVLTRP